MIIIIIYLVRKDFVSFKGEGSERLNLIRKKRILIFCTRVIIYTCLLTALASPFFIAEKTVKLSPRVVMLVDNSTSFSIFSNNLAYSLQKKLEMRLPVETRYIAFGDMSALGDGVLSNIQANDNVLLVTDGNNNHGASLMEAAFYARSNLNATLNAIKAEPEKEDAAVRIEGPSETVSGLENIFTVQIDKAKIASVRLKVAVDDRSVYDYTTSEDKVEIKRAFESGVHTLKAEIILNDYFPKNNVYYKTVKIIPKPKILFVTKKESPLSPMLKDLYDVKEASSLPSSLDGYYAVVFNDIPIQDIESKVTSLIDFVNDGNGIFVIGGKSSFDYSFYENSFFESLLPVRVDKEQRLLGTDASVVILVDISETMFESYTERGGKPISVAKAIVLDTIADLKPSDMAGVVAFSDKAYLVQPMTNVRNLGEEFENKVMSLKSMKKTWMYKGIGGAYNMIKSSPGSKNIVVISDGVVQRGTQTTLALEAAREAAKTGVRVHTIGVGKDTNEDFMKELAHAGNGQYFKLDESSNIRLVFGKTQKSSGENVNMDMIVLNSDHFITEGLSLKGRVNGFNFVAPKSAAQLLVTSDNGDPIVTAWRFGLGRVVAMTTDDGTRWARMFLQEDNLKLVSRQINWAVGDPKKYSDFYVDADDTYMGEAGEFEVISKNEYKSSEYHLYKADENLYRGSFKVEKTGFMNLLNTKVAVNNEKEYYDIGFNEGLNDVVDVTGGSVYTPEEIDKIISDVISRSEQTKVVKESLAWILVSIAAVIFLLEICLRRFWEYRKGW